VKRKEPRHSDARILSRVLGHLIVFFNYQPLEFLPRRRLVLLLKNKTIIVKKIINHFWWRKAQKYYAYRLKEQMANQKHIRVYINIEIYQSTLLHHIKVFWGPDLQCFELKIHRKYHRNDI